MSYGLFIAVEPITEPSTWALLSLAGGVFLSAGRLRHRLKKVLDNS